MNRKNRSKSSERTGLNRRALSPQTGPEPVSPGSPPGFPNLQSKEEKRKPSSFLLRKRLFSFFTLFFLFLLTACPDRKAQSTPEAAAVVSTIRPYYLLTRALLPSEIPVKLLIPPGSSPHTFALTPGQLKLLEDAPLIIANGGGLEGSLHEPLEDWAKKVFFAVSAVPEEKLLAGGEDHHEDEDHEGEHEEEAGTHKEDSAHDARDTHDDHDESFGFDPHVWLSPVNLRLITQALTRRLQALYPARSEEIRAHEEALLGRLDAVDDRIRRERKQISDPQFLGFHNAFGYFRERYRIGSAGHIVSSPGKEPGPRELTEIGEKVKKGKIKVIYIEPQLNPKAARVIAREFKLSVETLDPLGAGVENIPDLILNTWNIMKKHF